MSIGYNELSLSMKDYVSSGLEPKFEAHHAS